MTDSFCRLTAIFEKQQALTDKYGPIEEASGLLPAPLQPVDLHDRRGQALLRDFAWRITEELTEATGDLEFKGKMEDSFFMELIDALHFMVEICILSEVTPALIDRFLLPEEPTDVLVKLYLDVLDVPVLTPELFDTSFIKVLEGRRAPGLLKVVGKFSYMVIHELGKAINCLKNKPHKQSHVLTDCVLFRFQIIQSFKAMIKLFALVGLTPEQVYDTYVLKQKINQTRIDSNY